MAKMKSAELGRIKKSTFRAPWWARNRHVQTLWPRFFLRRKQIQLTPQRLELEDGDFVDLAWTPKRENTKGIVILFHGLEGSSESHYANDMLAVLHQQGWQAVIMHFRGCGGSANRLARAYHSGDTGDAWYFLNWLHKQYPECPKFALGFSLGANMLLKLLGENPKQKMLKAAVAVSTPFRLADCALYIAKGFSRVYQNYLLASLRKKIAAKMPHVDYQPHLAISMGDIGKLNNFYAFDEHITAPLHGFENADHYYQSCSAVNFTAKIETPTLILHSLDDPFMSENAIPSEQELSSKVSLELSEKGGHVGFVQGTPWNPKVWLHKRIPEYLDDCLTQ